MPTDSIKPALAPIFSNVSIPHPGEGFDHTPYVYSDLALEGMAALADEMTAEILSGRPVRIFFDNDGTLFRFVPDPKDVRMDPACYAGLVRLAQNPNVEATSLTGRDVHEASTLMLTPGYAVNDSHGRAIAAAGDKRLRFDVIGSHGVERLKKDGTLDRHAFGPDTDAFIASFKRNCAELRDDFPGITIEDGKHGAVAINVETVTGDETVKAAAYDAAATIMQYYGDSAVNPLHPDTGKPIFQIRREGRHELEFRPVGFGKDFGIRTFGQGDRDALTLFMCDSLGAEGTDRPAAELVNTFARGHVLLVRNGRNEDTPPDSAYHARAIFANPTCLGRFLTLVATQVEQARPSPGTAPAQQTRQP